jgi:hypothetical protein
MISDTGLLGISSDQSAIIENNFWHPHCKSKIKENFILIAEVRMNAAHMHLALNHIQLIGLITAGGLTTWTANLGGKIRHPEVSGNNTVMTLPAGNTNRDSDD